MATNVDQLLIRVTVDADTGKLKIANDDLKKLKETSANAGQEVTKLEKKVQTASVAFERKQKAIRNVNDTIVKSSGLFSSFGGVLGNVSGRVFDVSNQLEDLEFASHKAGKGFDAMTVSVTDATTAMGKLGTAALVVSSAIGGWQIGTWLNNNATLAKSIEDIINLIPGMEGFTLPIHNASEAFDALTNSAFYAITPVTLLAHIIENLGGPDTPIGKVGVHVTKLTGSVQGFGQAGGKLSATLTNLGAAAASLDAPMVKLGGSTKKATDEMQRMLDKGGKLPFLLENLKDSATRDAEAMEAFAKSLDLLDADSAQQGMRELLSNLELLRPATDAETTSMEGLALATGAASAAAENLGTHLKDSILGAISAIGSAIGGITGQITNFGTSLVSIWTSAGTVWEKVFNSIAAGAQLLIGLFQKLFGHDWSKDVSRTLNGIQVSEQMFKQLVQDSKDLHNARVAVFLDLQAIIQDVGLTAQNVSQFIEQLRAGFSLLQEGVITTDQLIGVLNDTFQELANASMSSTGIISNQMKEIITLTHQFGLEVQSVTDFIQGQLTTAFQGFDYLFNRWADRMKHVSVPDVTGNIKFNNPSENKFDHFSKQIVMWINQMLASGMSIDQVMQLAGGDLDRLVQIAKEFGYSLDPSLKQMIALRQESEKWGGVINAVNSQLVAMANVFDTIDPKNFMEILKDARPVFKDILKDGKLTKAEWLSIMPLIMTILQFSQQFGIKVPKWVQQIIDLAQKKHWLPQDLDTTVNVHYKKMDADSLHVKDLIVTGASGGPTGGGGQVNAAGASRNRAGGAGGASQTIKIKDQRPIEIKNTTQLVLTNKGVIALAKEVAKVFESGQVTFNYTIGSIGTTLKG